MPPRLPRWLVSRLAPSEDRDVIVGDLDEEFRQRARHRRSASAWYWRQALASAPSAVRLRWHRADLARDLSGDLRRALRLLWRRPGFTAAAVITLAFGAGIMTAVVSIAEAILVRPLPYANARSHRLHPRVRPDRPGPESVVVRLFRARLRACDRSPRSARAATAVARCDGCRTCRTSAGDRDHADLSRRLRRQAVDGTRFLRCRRGERRAGGHHSQPRGVAREVRRRSGRDRTSRRGERHAVHDRRRPAAVVRLSVARESGSVAAAASDADAVDASRTCTCSTCFRFAAPA